MSVVARACVALVAVALLAWLGVLERGTRLQAEGVALLRPGAGDGDLARAGEKLEAARLLNPDTAPDVSRALVHRARGDVSSAVALVEDVVRREPDNLRAWGVLLLLAEGDEGVARRALAAQRRLDPLNARAR
jgi:hypothetical protein